ncbi:MAG TPA: class I adenylate-forming enzyme family protein [Casimicrobiaceae bacterium]|nr:class I adenylate-forming enzyme family protein [Casimicrobiaceae bacterium]
MNITEPLRALAGGRPDTVAVVRPRGGKVTLREFERQVDHIARRCLAVGVGPGTLVLVAVRRPLRLLQIELALARIGAAAMSPSVDRTLAEVRFIEGDAKPNPPPGRHYIDAWFDEPAGEGPPVAMHDDPAATAIVCPSSGTTGTPKAIPIGHAQLAARIAAANQGVPLPAAPRQVCVPTAASGFGIVTLLRVLYAGGTLVAAATPAEIIAAVERFHVNRITMSPIWVEQLVSALPATGNPLAALEEIELGGASLPPSLYRLARERLCERLYSIYGSTESGFIATGLLDGLDLERGEVGRVLPALEVEAFDADGRQLPRGSEGILRMRGPVCVDRYLGAPEASAETFRDGWVALPDLGRITEDGTLSVVGRANDVINVGGYKVNPTDIEKTLLSLDFIADAAAFGVPDPNGIVRLCAAIVLRAPVDRATLDARLRERMSHQQPSLVLQVKSIPRNEGGKILRQQLVALASGARVH